MDKKIEILDAEFENIMKTYEGQPLVQVQLARSREIGKRVAIAECSRYTSTRLSQKKE